MNKKNEYKESFINWLKTKGIIIIGVIVIIGIICLIRWLVVIPYKMESYLGIGHWGIIIGGILMFILVNIPLGIIFTIFKFEQDNIVSIEIGFAVGSAVIVGITYLIVYTQQIFGI